MNKERLNRTMWVGALGATAVVFIILVSGRSRGPVEPPVELPGPGHVPAVPSKEPISLSPRNLPPEIVRGAHQTVFQQADPETGALKNVFIADRVTPGAKGEIDAEKPQVLMFLSKKRVLHLEGERGHFVVPENIPESGEFTGALTLTFYDAGEDEDVDFTPDSGHVVMRLELPGGAVFDATRGEVRSSGAVRLTTPGMHRATMKGQGLYLVYNDLEQRIDRLTIDKLERMRIEVADSSAADVGARSGGEKAKGGKKEAVAGEAEVEYYLVEFEESVQVTSSDPSGGPGESIDADRMLAYLSIERSSKASEDPSGVEESEGEGSEKTASEPAPVAVSSGRPKRIIEITGGGKLVMVPQETLPEEAEGMRSFYLRFMAESRPVLASLQRSLKLRAQSLDYLDTGRRVIATGSAEHPLRVDSSDLGQLAALRLVVGLDANEGRLEGPGFIRAVEAGEGAKTERALPPGFHAKWSNSVHFKFAAEGAGDETGTAEDGNPLLTSVTFLGGVQIGSRDPNFTIDAEQVAARFMPIDGKSVMSNVDAAGNVRVQSDEGGAEAGKLWMELDTGDPEHPTPRSLRAEENARFQSAEGMIAADHLDVAFAEAVAGGAKTDDTTAVGGSLSRFSADVSRVLAQGNVRMEQGELTVTCERLEADRTTGLATLTGRVTIDRGAKGEDPPFRMGVARLELDETKKTAVAPGPGEITITRVRRDGSPDAPPVPVTVTWTDRMSFDQGQGLIHLFGEVRAEEKNTQHETHRLRSQQLTLELVSAEVVRDLQSEVEEQEAEKKEGLFESDLTNRQVRKLIARGDVVVDAWEDDPADAAKVVWRFTLMGPQLEFMLASDVARVIGEGKMLVEDYRGSGDVEPSKGDQPLDQFSGKGKTYFTWVKELTFDKGAMKLTMEESVRMTHLPDGGKPQVELMCESLMADAVDSNTIEVIGMEMGALRVESVEAVGAVRIEQGFEKEVQVTADRLSYDGANELVTLIAEGENVVEVSDIKQSRPARGREIKWNLKTGRKEVTKPVF